MKKRRKKAHSNIPDPSNSVEFQLMWTEVSVNWLICNSIWFNWNNFEHFNLSLMKSVDINTHNTMKRQQHQSKRNTFLPFFQSWSQFTVANALLIDNRDVNFNSINKWSWRAHKKYQQYFLLFFEGEKVYLWTHIDLIKESIHMITQ